MVPNDPERAIKTAPVGIIIKASNIPNAGLGAFANKAFPARTRFGPYEGTKEDIVDESEVKESGYSWLVS